MTTYRIRYETDVEAESAEKAAEIGWRAITDNASDPEAYPPVLGVEAWPVARPQRGRLFEIDATTGLARPFRP
jgi:hypothetical protein